MLHLTQLAGFASQSATADIMPDPITIPNISDAGFVASAQTNTVAITGINASVTLRLTLSVAMSPERTIDAWRDGALVNQSTAGSTIDVTLTNMQTLHY